MKPFESSLQQKCNAPVYLSCVRTYALLNQREIEEPSLLNLADNLACPRQALHHLLALLAPADGVVRLLQQVVHVLLPVELLEELGLHGVLCESGMYC